MVLVIPAIEIKGGRCVQMVQGVEGFTYSDDPVEMGKLWRRENAKSLQVTDVDGALTGRPLNREVIRRLMETIDIPISLGGGLRTFDDVREAITLGAYRAVIGTMMLENEGDVKRAVDAYGPSKIVLAIDAIDGIVQKRGWQESSGQTIFEVALKGKAAGVRRLSYTDIRLDGTLRGVNMKALQELGEKTGLRITASGGIGGLNDLLRVQELEKYGVDSVLIGRALYENKFACQGLWRLCEAGNYPFTAKV